MQLICNDQIKLELIRSAIEDKEPMAGVDMTALYKAHEYTEYYVELMSQVDAKHLGTFFLLVAEAI